MRGTLVVLLLVAAGVAASGCLDLHAARVPERLLEGGGGNGWTRNATASQQEPRSQQLGLASTQTFVYDDRASRQGYDGSLSVTTLRTLLRPDEAGLRDTVQERVRDEAARKGIRITSDADRGTRALAHGAESFWFAYDGRVDQEGFFAQSAEVKVFGEVFQCVNERTVVATVGLAQVSDVRSVSGVPLPSEPDDTTWREIVRDPPGTIDGARGSDGLAYNVLC